MPTIKQKTVDGRTYELKRYRTDKPGKQYEYYVTEDGAKMDDEVYTREAGERQFRETIQVVETAAEKDRGGGGGGFPGVGGPAGGGASIPGIGRARDEDDDGDPELPFF